MFLQLLLALWFVAGLSYLGLRHYVWPHLDHWLPEITGQLSALAGRPVEVAAVRTGFDGLLPMLVAERVTIADDDGSAALEVPRMTAVLSLRTLLAGELRLASLVLERPMLRVERRADGSLRVAGIDVPRTGPEDGLMLDRLLSQRRIVVRAGRFEWVDAMTGARDAIGPVDAAIGSVGRRHRASIAFGEAPGAWSRLRFAAEVYRPPHTRTGDWTRWSGELYAEGEGLDAGALRVRVPAPAPGWLPSAGTLRVKAWADFDGGRIRGGLARLSADGLAVPAGAGAPVVLDMLETEATLRVRDDGQELRFQRLAARAGDFSVAALGEQQLRLDAAGRPVAGRLSTGPIEVAPALAFVRRLPLDDEVLQLLQALSASGRIGALSARWSAPATPGAPEYDVAVEFDGLSLRYARDWGGGPAAQQMPWFERLSGQARLTGNGGELRIDASDSTLVFPGVFAEPAIPLRSLKAEASWRFDGDGEARRVHVDLARLRFANADAEGVVSGSYQTGGKGAGIVDLQGRLERASASRAARYVPLSIPQEERSWIADALAGGRLSDVRLRVRGDLDDFPFRRPEQGEFSVRASISDATLRYAPGWPAIERFEGSLAFERAGMRVSMRSGRVFDVALGTTEAVIADFAKPMLHVQGAGEGPAADMIRFVNQSPVATRIDDFTRDTSARGNARLQLKLDLPLDAIDQSRVTGAVYFLGNDLTLDRTVPPFSGVSGKLEFTELGMALRGMTATFLGGPLRVEGETSEPGHFSIRGEGSLAAEGMRSVVDNPLTHALSGKAAYVVNIDVRRRAASVTIESDLQGLAAALPAPFAKTAGERWPLRVQTQATMPANPDARPDRDTIRVELRDGVRIALERERDPRTERLLIRRGAFAMGADPVMPASGLAVVLNTTELDADAWTALLTRDGMRDAQDRATTEFAEGFSLLPDSVSVVSRHVRVGGKDLNDVVFGATRIGGLWQANIASREASGFFVWREAAPGHRTGTITARFTRLEIPRSRAGEVESLLDTPPQDLPGLDIAAEEFVLFDRPLGTLALRATNSPGSARPVWTLNELRIVNPSASLTGRGAWAPSPLGRGRTTRLEFDLSLADAGGLLAVYGLKDVMRNGAGTIGGELRWSGSPLALDYGTLGGRMTLKVGKGQFLKTEPGIAKLIGVLNLQSLPRRLALDFRDVFAEGFSFDEITGDVTIERGVARTENLSMRGVQAKVAIHGSANIEAETQALDVEVTPDLNAGLASIAYGAMVNPVVGIGSFVAQMVLRSPIQQILSYEYEVSGSWADPQVVERRRRVTPANTDTR